MTTDRGTSMNFAPLELPQLVSGGAFFSPIDRVSTLLPLSLGDAGTAKLISEVPVDGSQLSADAEIARFTPIVATIQVESAKQPIVYAVIGSMWWLVFDGTRLPTSSSPMSSTGFAPFMREHSTIALVADFQYQLSIIPNGGWWRSGFTLRYASGQLLD